MLFPMFVLGAVVGALIGAAFAVRNLHLLRRTLAAEMRHDLVDEFRQQFRHLDDQLEYLEAVVKNRVLNQYDLSIPAQRPPMLPDRRVS
jgi:hypothetical protein